MQTFSAVLFLALVSISFQVLAMDNQINDQRDEHFSVGDRSPSINLLADPAFKAFIDEFAEHFKAISPLSLPEQRRLDAEFVLKHNTCLELVHRIENFEILGNDDNKIPLRIYVPNEFKNLPTIVYFHGGGWVYGGIEEADAVCRRLANHLGCIIASVGYRLAPEFPFPKPLEDCYVATKWVIGNVHLFGGDNNNVIVGGESAGGNLAAAVALMARDKQGPKLAAQLLIYPIISSTIQDKIYDNCPDHYFITKDVMRFFWSMYTQLPGEDKNPYASLDKGTEFSGLPPTIMLTAEYDPMSTDNTYYASQLQKAGVQVLQKTFSKAIHGFLYVPLYDEKQKVQWTKEIRSSLVQLGIIQSAEPS